MSSLVKQQTSVVGVVWPRHLVWCSLLLLLVAGIPPFLCMPLTGDTVFYDLQVRNLLQGGTLYDEIFETNLCGAVWLHQGVRSLLGWSSEAIRSVDLVMLCVTIWLLSRWLKRFGRDGTVQVGGAAAMFLCYFSLSEWCHCQRDTWMLLFALLALELRFRQMARFESAPASGRSFPGLAFAEGIVWSLGFWIKPFVAIPGAACWLLSVWLIRRRVRNVGINGVSLLTGGLVSGAAGIAWLAASGAIPHLIDTQINWNPGYFSKRTDSWLPLMVGVELWPWWCLHLLALPTVMGWLRRAADDGRSGRRLLATFYVAWLVQSFLLQWWHPYVHVPGILLAITVCSTLGEQLRPQVWRTCVAAFGVIALVSSPVLTPGRLQAWPVCLWEGSTPRVRDMLRLPYNSWYRGSPDSVNLQEIADFLRAQGVEDGEVVCYQWSTMQLYHDLHVRPPCRFVCPREYAMGLFPDRADEIRSLLEASPQRFVVSDLNVNGLPPELTAAVGPDGPHAPPPIFPQHFGDVYPWSHPVVFRSGRYMVHAVAPPMGDFAELTLLAPPVQQKGCVIVEIGISK